MERFKKNGDLFCFIRENNLKITNCADIMYKMIISQFQIVERMDNVSLQMKLKTFCKHLKSRWTASNYDFNKFVRSNNDWLNSDILLLDESKDLPETQKTMATSTVEKRSGKDFELLSDRQKRRRTEHIRNTSEMADFIAKKSIKSIHAEYIYDFIKNHPEHVKKVRKFCEEILNTPSTISDESALSVFTAAKLSRHQHNIIRNTVNNAGKNILPSYYKIQQAKKECLPDPKFVIVSDIGVNVSLQSIMDHTAFRFLKFLQTNLNGCKKVTMISKWGCDGASDQSRYKIYSESLNDDSSMFICCFVPIKIYCDITNSVIWQNSRPSSCRFCRPIQFRFVKEDENEIKTCVQDIQDQISRLKPSVY